MRGRGHEHSNTTQFYTHVAIRTLQAIPAVTHPGYQSDKEGAETSDAPAQDETTGAE